MDIDEFLDRELSELNLDTGKSEKTEASGLKESTEASPLFESIRAEIGKGNLELAEQSYVQLWHILAGQKLKWDKELYEELLALSRQFSGALSQAFNEVKAKANSVYELIGRGRNALREGRKELPFKIYSEVEQIINSIPNVFFEEKKTLQEHASDFYKELKSITDNELVKRVSALLQEVNMLIDRINSAIRANDMVNAIVNYNKCLELYNQIPEGFLMHKNSIGMRLLDIYKTLSIYTEISSLQKQLSKQPTVQGIRTQQPLQAAQQPKHAEQQMQQPLASSAREIDASAKSMLIHTKRELAKRHIEKGFYSEAAKGIDEVLQLEPNDAEAKALRAKIKTLQ